MPDVTEHTEDELVLGVQLSEIAKAASWVERLSSRYAIPESVQFAINLCLEEVLSNIILHGYKGETDRTVVVRFAILPYQRLLFVVDDEAPHFNPLDQPELSALNPNEEIRIGGQGLRLLRQFSDSLEYERTPTGNRMKIGFSAASSHNPSEQGGD